MSIRIETYTPNCLNFRAISRRHKDQCSLVPELQIDVSHDNGLPSRDPPRTDLT